MPSGILYVISITVAPLAAATPSPVLFANANSWVASLGTSVALYASEPVALTCSIGASGLITMRAPAIGSAAFSVSRTVTFTVTVSPGLPTAVPICQPIAPLGTVTVVVVVEPDVVVVLVVVEDLTSMKPSTSSTNLLIDLPSVLLINASDHLTGYFPYSQFSGTLYVSTSTFEPSAALTPSPVVFANANSLVSLLGTSLAE